MMSFFDKFHVIQRHIGMRPDFSILLCRGRIGFPPSLGTRDLRLASMSNLAHLGNSPIMFNALHKKKADFADAESVDCAS